MLEMTPLFFRLLTTLKELPRLFQPGIQKMSGTQRKNAEWIFEAPSSNRVLPLTNVQRAYLSNCMAKINGIKRPLNSPFFANNSIEMVTNNGTSKAIPSAISSGGSSFSVTWLHE
jgi:hypothetical protein